MDEQTLEKATLGGGCFWCLEAVFLELKGITHVESGYAGGNVKNPTYYAVCDGTTGHAEVIKIIFDPSIITFKDILFVFFTIHDPTTLNRQGADAGTQYRSIILYEDQSQKEISESVIEELNQEKIWKNKIVTEVVPLNDYYTAEIEHQNYYARNTNQGYCRAVIAPKLNKFRKKYYQKLKK